MLLAKLDLRKGLINLTSHPTTLSWHREAITLAEVKRKRNIKMKNAAIETLVVRHLSRKHSVYTDTEMWFAKRECDIKALAVEAIRSTET